jgi:dipeptidyl aminopeptidase/acylaminoacyl peptidase
VAFGYYGEMGRPILLCHALLAGWACAQTEPIPVRPLALTWTAGYGDMEELAFSNDGRSLAVLTSLGFRILDAQDGRVLNSVTRFPVRVMSGLDTGICWSPDGKRIARAYEGVEIWDASGQQPERDFPASNDDGIFKRPTWSPAGDLVAVSANEGIVLLNLNSGGRSLIPGPADDDNNVLEVQQGFSWSPDGRMLAVYVFREDVIVSPVGALSRTTESERIDIWDVSRIALLRSIPLTGLQKFQHGFYQGIEEGLFTPDDAVVAWSPDGKVLAVDSGRTGLSLWSFRKGKLLCQLTSGIRLISWSRDSTTLHTRIDQEVRFINRNNGETVYSRKTEDKSLDSIVVSADGRHCAVIVGNSEIDLWRGRQQRPSVQIPWTGAVGLRGPPYWPYGVSPNGRQTVLVVGDAAEIRETESGRRVLGPFPVPDSISWSPISEVIEMVRLLLGRLIRTADGQQTSSFSYIGVLRRSRQPGI